MPASRGSSQLGLNSGLLNRRQILYHLSHQGSPLRVSLFGRPPPQHTARDGAWPPRPRNQSVCPKLPCDLLPESPTESGSPAQGLPGPAGVSDDLASPPAQLRAAPRVPQPHLPARAPSSQCHRPGSRQRDPSLLEARKLGLVPGTTCQAPGTTVLPSGRPAPWKKHLESVSSGVLSAMTATVLQVTAMVLQVVGTGAGAASQGRARAGSSGLR